MAEVTPNPPAMQSSSLVGAVIGEKFTVTLRIGGGSFGEIYKCSDNEDGTVYAAKFESRALASPQLRHEYKIYRELKGLEGICEVQYFGDFMPLYRVLIMELKGPSLEDCFEKCGKRFSLKTVLRIADQLLVRINSIHKKAIIHRDIKPQNFVMGLGDQKDTIFCVDFGLAKLYRDRRTSQHLPKREGSLAGTPRYASINNHLGVAQSRRDDYESIAYMLIYFLQGRLPWQGLKAMHRGIKYRLILQSKQTTKLADLCGNIPNQFGLFLKYCRHMKFSEDVDLFFCRKLFQDLYIEKGYDQIENPLWDWEQPDPKGGCKPEDHKPFPPPPPTDPVETSDIKHTTSADGDQDSLEANVGKD